jgi:phytanoyl-CoA hydroxylase
MAPRARLGALRSHLLRDNELSLRPAAAAAAAPAAAAEHDEGAEEAAPGLPEGEIAHFKQHGFVIAKGLLRESDFDDLIGAYDALITQKASPLFEAGLLSSLYEDSVFHERLAALRADPRLPAERRGELTTQIDIYEARLPEMFKFLFNKRLLAGVSSLLGPELTLSPIQHIRPFTADASGSATGPQWHMDQAVTLEEADVAEIVTAWIPFCDTFPENGCLQFVDGIASDAEWRSNRDAHLTIGHHQSPHVHVQDRGKQQLEVPAPFLERLRKTQEDVRVVEAVMEKGDVLLFNAYVPHRGGVNSSPDLVRWSMDLRFQATGTPTGRPHWPEFILQSHADPSIVQGSYDEWCSRWVTGLASPSKDLHRQPPKGAPLSPGDRVRIVSLTTAEDEGAATNTTRSDLALVEERLDGPPGKDDTYLLQLMDGSGTKTERTREELEVF